MCNLIVHLRWQWALICKKGRIASPSGESLEMHTAGKSTSSFFRRMFCYREDVNTRAGKPPRFERLKRSCMHAEKVWICWHLSEKWDVTSYRLIDWLMTLTNLRSFHTCQVCERHQPINQSVISFRSLLPGKFQPPWRNCLQGYGLSCLLSSSPVVAAVNPEFLLEF